MAITNNVNYAKRENPANPGALSPSFAFEHVAAKLVPFDLPNILDQSANPNQEQPEVINPHGTVTDPRTRTRETGNSNTTTDHALSPIIQTGGLIFPHNPTISEGVNIKYDMQELTHSNESYYSYKATDNVRIGLADCVWTCDTFDNAVYALSVLHFFRSYSMMDFGSRRTGRPPSPMWFSAYGNYAFHRVPVLMEKADWTFPNDVDYVGIPETGSPEYMRREIKRTKTPDGKYTWLPIIFKVSSISLIVQHSPRYWINWSLDDYRSGTMLRRKDQGSFHATNSGKTG
jgi:hypothetical protein